MWKNEAQNTLLLLGYGICRIIFSTEIRRKTIFKIETLQTSDFIGPLATSTDVLQRNIRVFFASFISGLMKSFEHYIIYLLSR